MLNEIKDVNQELFVIHDPTHKLTINVRDASEAQLEKARAGAQQAQAQLIEQIQQNLAQFQQACMAHAVFAYEQDRRKRSLSIARIIPS